MGNEHKQLLLHCIWWFSRDKVLSRLFDIRDELMVFFIGDYEWKRASSYLDCVIDENWLKRLAYLADIFCALNIFNITLQGEDIHKCLLQDKIEALIMKLQWWALMTEKDSFNVFCPTWFSWNQKSQNWWNNSYNHKRSSEISGFQPQVICNINYFFLIFISVTFFILSAFYFLFIRNEETHQVFPFLFNYFPKIEGEIQEVINPFDEGNIQKVNISSSEEASLNWVVMWSGSEIVF